MKRQGSSMDATGQGREHDGRRKKSKRAVELETKEEGGEVMAAEGGMQSLVWWEEWQWLRGAADEKMPWASMWSPLWGVDFVDKAYGALFSDVAWDDDIWSLKTVMAIPPAMSGRKQKHSP
ncbi:hypothetical protein HRI_002452100 [Hibiscus trionum]|uniref:Uncharacterized protein n=1 Tax=Hibiscus trionum TaxID=183268 RepID=A0A9W7M4R1_HIBTR|nr:hypothetical protein HRI_002452100 [Hibiscus trionum]